MENKVLAIVDGREVKESDYNSLMQNLGKNASFFQGDDGRKKLVDELIMHELIYSDALENDLEKDEEFINVFYNMKKSLLQQYGLSKLMSNITITDEEIAEYYEKNKSTYKTQEMVRASHILVDSEEKANEILEDITDGLKFEDAAFSMRKGEISNPVKTQFGYHIIKLVDTISERDSSLDEVKEEIRKKCIISEQDKAYYNKKEELKQKYKVEIVE